MHWQPPFAHYFGMKITRMSPDRAEGELVVREELTNGYGILHGGALMAFADTLGGSASRASLPPDVETTTIESKTNFLAPIPLGDTVHGECTALHKGRTLMVWQTRVTRGDGKLAAVVTQTQMTIVRKG